MAARKTLWLFYVYELVEGDRVRYVGKGSGRRLQNQRRKFKLEGREVARFWREDDAYNFERERIADQQPDLNKLPGGNGSRVIPPRPRRRFAWEIEADRIGTRAYAAKVLLSFDLSSLFSPSELDENRSQWRAVLDGARA
jgi:hypothetical protein